MPDSKTLILFCAVIVVIGIVAQVILSFNKYRAYKTSQIENFNDYLFNKYGRVFKLALYEKDNCLYSIDENCYFRVMQNNSGIITDNKAKSYTGLLVTKYLSEKIKGDGIYVSASVNSVYDLNYDTIKEILDDRNKLLVHIAIGVIVNDNDDLDKIEQKIRKMCSKIRFDNSDINILLVDAVNGNEVRRFIETYYISDGDASVYSGHVKRFIKLKRQEVD